MTINYVHLILITVKPKDIIYKVIKVYKKRINVKKYLYILAVFVVLILIHVNINLKKKNIVLQ